MIHVRGILFIVFVFLLLSVRSQVVAQTRGEGVGALLGNFAGPAKIKVSDGKTAPRATVFVENGEGAIQVEAALDEQGVFTFTFGTDTDNVGHLFLFASDTVGTTKKVPIAGTEFDGVLLPPTISVEPNPSTSRVVVYGYTFPGADVELTVRSPEAVSQRYQTVAEPSGKWTIHIPELGEGKYSAEVLSRIDSLESEPSTPIAIDVAVSLVTSILRAAPSVLIAPAAVVTLAPTGLAFGDIPYYVARVFLFLRGLLFFWRRKSIRWGIVYDGLTKHPISGAIVRLYRDVGGLVETEVTGTTGAFSFLPQPGRYTIRTIKPGYIFPSRIVEGKLDGEYDLVYHGEVFDVRSFTSPLSLSVALDPKDHSLTGFRAFLRQLVRQYGIFFQLGVLVLGVSVSVVAAVAHPAWYNIVLIVLYVFLFLFLIVRSWRDATVWGVVVDEQGNPAPLVSLSLLETTFHRQVQRRVSDPFGRYQFVVPAGAYVILVSSSGWELAPTKRSYDGTPLRVSKQSDIVKPTVVVRKKHSLQSSPQV